MAAKTRTRASKGRSGRNDGIAARTFKEIRSSLDSLRDLMESYLPAGRGGSKRLARRSRRKPAAKTTAHRAPRKARGRTRRGAKG